MTLSNTKRKLDSQAALVPPEEAEYGGGESQLYSPRTEPGIDTQPQELVLESTYSPP